MGASAVLLGGGIAGHFLEKAAAPDPRTDKQKLRDSLMVTGAGQKILAAHPELGAEDAPKTPPIPTLTPADAQQAASDAGNAMQAQLKKNQGRMSTLLTGPIGIGTTSPANLQFKTLLGQ